MKEEKEENFECAGSCSACHGCSHEAEDFELPEDFEPVITLTDDKGNDVRFEILDVVILEDGKEYLVLSEVGKDDDDEKTDVESENIEVTILEIKDVDGEEVYDTVTDEKVAEKVFDIFVKQQEETDED